MIKKTIKRKLKNAINNERSIIHFSNLKNKLGINPRTDYNTPAGVYGYILDENSLNCVLVNKRLTISESIKKCKISKFGIDRKYLYVAEINPSKKIIRIKEGGVSNFTKQDLARSIYDILIMVDKKDSKIDHKLFNLSEYELRDFINEKSEKSFFKTPFGEFWNITRSFARNAVAWGRLLYDLGISAVFDYGAGLIHKAEPSQAVVLETHRLDVIYHGKNKLNWSSSNNPKIFENYKMFNRIFSKDKYIDMYNFLNSKLSYKEFLFDINNKLLFGQDSESKAVLINNSNPNIIYLDIPVNDIIEGNNIGIAAHKTIGEFKILVSINFEEKNVLFFMRNYTSSNKLRMIDSNIVYGGENRYTLFKKNNKKIVIDTYPIDFKSMEPNIIGVYRDLPKNDIELYELIEMFLQEISDVNVYDKFIEESPEKDGLLNFVIDDFMFIEHESIENIKYHVEFSFLLDVFGQCFIQCRVVPKGISVFPFVYSFSFYGGMEIFEKLDNMHEDFFKFSKDIQKIDLNFSGDTLDFSGATESYSFSSLAKNDRILLTNIIYSFIEKYKHDNVVVIIE